jgi:3-oxoacyl-[acyl-carrier-protein] synthase III
VTDSFVSTVSVLLPEAIPVSEEEVASAPEWRAVCQDPGRTPVDMAIESGRPAVENCGIEPDRFDWLIHTGSGPQGTRAWPAHHAIQSALLGSNGNAFEVRQFCAGGLSSWVLAQRMRNRDRAVVCTAADNWSWTDRFAVSRNNFGEPGADLASAAVIGPDGFAQIVGSGNASCPDHAEAWFSDDRYWELQPNEEFRVVYARALSGQTSSSMSALVEMIGKAIRFALDDAEVPPSEVTHFVAPGSRYGEPYRYLAGVIGLPWSDELHRFHLEHGYLSVSGPAAALVSLAKAGALSAGATVLLTATEYNVSTTAMVLRITRSPEVVAQDHVTIVH